jgi:tetratricopeptide (TPR) repeat protein
MLQFFSLQNQVETVRSRITLILTVVLWGLIGARAGGQERDHLENYLRSLGLQRLLIKHLENEIQAEQEPAVRMAKAKRLADLYSDQLLDTRVATGELQKWMDRARNMVAVYPALESNRLRIAMLQARFLLEETQFRDRWLKPRSNGSPQLFAPWRELQSDLQQFQEKLQDEAEELATTLQLDPANDTLARRSNQIESILLHASFLTGWTSYYCGVLQAGERLEWLRRADEYFRDFLQLEKRKSLTEFTEKWFDFDSRWQLRGVIGLGVAHRGLNHPQQSEHCFRLLRNQPLDSSTRTQVYVWDLFGRLYVGDERSVPMCVDRFKSDLRIASSDEIVFWTAALKANDQLALRSPEVARGLRREALGGLVRGMQWATIHEFITSHEVELDDDFLGNWIGGYAQMQGESEDLESAQARLERALQSVDSSIAESDVFRCRYLLGQIYYRQRAFDPASQIFQMVSVGLENVDRALAAESQWFAARSLEHSNRNSGGESGLAYLAYDRLERRFPESDFARRARFEKIRLRVAGLPGQQALDQLSSIEASDPNFGLALYEILRVQFRRWLESQQSGNQKSGMLLKDLRAAEMAVRKSDAVSTERKLKSLLLVIDALMRTQPSSQDEIIDLFSIADKFQNSIVESEAPVIAEYRAYRMRFFESIKDYDGVQKEAIWLVEKASQTPFYRSGLIQLAKLWDAKIANADDPDPANELYRLQLYRKLVADFGTGRETLLGTPNAQVALSKLGALELSSGNFENAENAFSKLLEIQPNHRFYLRQLAETKLRLNQYDAALQIWRKINRGVSPGSDAWYESKHRMITCLLESDPDAARKVFRQTVQLSPELPPKWSLLFADLEAKLQ